MSEAPIAVEFFACSGCSSSDAATGPDPDRLPVAGVRDAPV
ncbi:putative lipoprotein [Mycobacterium ulcerans str. Harvey]|uniref:Lipoprotein n=1 Tax=Mycobacterium ulcerans str. Harvey TaxID=1299332 RepID=A0ABP3A560_MYCUL|nr:putative lipoprotein [Mycobacterium ulcerans str. Harvey]